MKRAVVALTIVAIWIVAICTVPQVLGSYLWYRFEYVSDLPLEPLLPDALSAVAVLVFILGTRRSALLVPEWPKDPRCLLILVPLACVNVVLRGPLVGLSLPFVLVVVVTTFLTAFWEEFLFRGLIQDRLSILGYRLSVLSTALLFSFPHANKGLWPMLFSLSVGLVFSTLREGVGLWALVLAHWTINLTVPIFVRPTWNYISLATPVYMGVGLALLATMKGAADSAGSRGSRSDNRKERVA